MNVYSFSISLLAKILFLNLMSDASFYDLVEQRDLYTLKPDGMSGITKLQRVNCLMRPTKYYFTGMLWASSELHVPEKKWYRFMRAFSSIKAVSGEAIFKAEVYA